LDYLETDFFDFQIPSNNISFDAPSAGDAHGTLYFCIWAVLSLKTGVRRVEPLSVALRLLPFSSSTFFR
jgi:hypothetical protein